MHPAEVEQALGSLTILVDTREHPTEQAQRRYASFGCPWRREKLFAGDYSATVTLPDGSEFSLADSVTVERKSGFDELCQCFTHERKRFAAEFDRAQAEGMWLYLLVEYGTWENAYSGKYRSQMKPNALTGSLLAWVARYGSPVLMCKPETSGRLIRDVLYREMKERLLKYD